MDIIIINLVVDSISLDSAIAVSLGSQEEEEISEQGAAGLNGKIFE